MIPIISSRLVDGLGCRLCAYSNHCRTRFKDEVLGRIFESGLRASFSRTSSIRVLGRRYLSVQHLQNGRQRELLVAAAGLSSPSSRIPIWLRRLLGKNRISILAGNLWSFLGPIRGLDASRMAFWFFGNVRGTGTHWLIQLIHFRLSSLGLFLVPGSNHSLLVCHNCPPCRVSLRLVSDLFV